MSHSTAFAAARAPAGVAQRAMPSAKAQAIAGTPVGQRAHGMFGKPIVAVKPHHMNARGSGALKVFAVKDGATLDRPLRVAVIGGGPSGACAAETLAQGGVEAFLIERKMDNCKVRGPGDRVVDVGAWHSPPPCVWRIAALMQALLSPTESNF